MQEASVMAACHDGETPLIYSTQTAATVADLEMEDKNRESMHVDYLEKVQS